MICEKYEAMTTIEKTEFVGKLLHSVQSSNELFDLGKEIINLGIEKGLFEGVKILHPNTKDV